MRHARKPAETAETVDIDERLAPYFGLPVPGVQAEVLVAANAAASAVPPVAHPTRAQLVAGTQEERTNAQSPAR